jgi:CBS domain-containing protein
MQAKDVMTVNVISVSEDTPVHEVVGKLLKHRISAVPVVDREGRVVGIISEGDLLRQEEGGPPEARATLRLSALGGQSAAAALPSWRAAAGPEAAREAHTKAHGHTAGSVMTRNVITVNEDAPLNEIAAILERHHIKRVPVLRNGRIVGIVSRANLLHGLADTIIERHEPGAAKDRHLREQLLKVLLHEHKLDTVLVNVTVNDGNVRLWGVVENAEQAAVAERAARALPGVKSVQNNLGTGPMSGVPI